MNDKAIEAALAAQIYEVVCSVDQDGCCTTYTVMEAPNFALQVGPTYADGHEATTSARRLNMRASNIAYLRNVEVSEGVWDGLPRQLIMWMDMEPKTSRALFNHLEQSGYEVPQWLRDEPEMQSLDHVPSKGTRSVLVFKAICAAMADELENGV